MMFLEHTRGPDGIWLYLAWEARKMAQILFSYSKSTLLSLNPVALRHGAQTWRSGYQKVWCRLFGVGKFGVGKFGVRKFGVGKFGVGMFGVGKFGVGKFGVDFLESESLVNFQKKGLLDLYENPRLKVLLRSFTALAFLPVDEVASGFDELALEIEGEIAVVLPPEKAQTLRDHIRYIEKTYIRRTVGLNNRSPLYPIQTWNCFYSILAGQPRTNNAMEGWHKEFNKKFSKRNLNLSHFILKMKEEEHETWQLAIRHAANPADPLRNKRSTRVTNSEKQISKLVSSYAELERVNRQRLPYLQTIQHHLGKFYTPVAAANDDSEENEENELENSNNLSNPQNILDALNMLPA